MQHSAYTQAVIDAVKCRHCDSVAGDDCRRPDGSIIQQTHQIRYQDASEAGVKAP